MIAVFQSLLLASAVEVFQPAAELPVLEETDVLVVGGGYAATAAALEAKASGAKVFVVMPRQNPADDLVSTRRLWLMPDDEGLDDPLIAEVYPKLDRASFTYVPSIVAVSPHQDDSHVILRDGVWNDAANNSAQYGSKEEPCTEVTLTVTPEAGSSKITCVKLCYYTGGGDYGGYETDSMVVRTNGVELAGEYEKTGGNGFNVIAFTPSSPIPSDTVLTLTSTTAANAVRQLIGEIILETDSPWRQSSTKPTILFKTIDKALMAAEIPYFTGAPVCDVVRDADAGLAGVIVANRSGRQAVLAKAIVDATEWGTVARKVATLRKGPETTAFTQVVTLAADADFQLPEGYSAVEKSSQVSTVTIRDNKPSNDAPASYAAKTLAITKTFPLASFDWRNVNAVVNAMRNDLWHKSVADWSEKPFFVPPEQIVGRADDPYRPDGIDNLFVAGMLADVDRAAAEKISYLGNSVKLGRRLGKAAAELAADRTARDPYAQTPDGLSAGSADGAAVVRETIRRPLHVGSSAATFASPASTLPVLDEVDVLVVGGGTAGCPAAIAAAGEGKRVLLVEWLYCLGGTTTEGRIGTYYRGLDRGWTKTTLDAGTRGANAIGWVFSETKSEWFRRTATADGATVLFGSFVEGAVVEGADEQGRAKVRGAVVVLPDGTRGAVKAKVVVDSTGNADVAASAGAETVFLSPKEFAMQGSAASPHQLGRSYYNTDVGFLNSPDAGDLFTFALRARLGVPEDKNWNLSHVHVGARERRRIVGDYVVTPEDELTDKRYHDTIMHGQSDYDMHGFSTTPLMMFHNRPKGVNYTADLPYRSLLPRKLSGLLVTGLAVSADRDAMPLIRMQRDVQNQGYAAGLAAAAACDAGDVRAIDVKALQRKLVTAKNLSDRVLTDVDSTCDAARLEDAIAELDCDFLTLPWILAWPAEALPKVKTAFETAEEGSDHRKALACALLLLGDQSGFDVVAGAFTVSDVTLGSVFKGLGNYGRQTSGFDLLLYALAASGNPKAAGVIARRIPEFVASDSKNTIRAMSHFRMGSLAAEALVSERIAAQLTALTGRNAYLKNQVKTEPMTAVSYGGDNSMDEERTRTIRELAHLRARRRFGDADAEAGLRAYLNDYRTIYASFAELALAEPQLGKTVGVWTDPDHLLIDLGTPQFPATMKGRVSVTDATVILKGAVNTVDSGVDYKPLADGSFEPTDGKTDLTKGVAPSGRDKRGSAAQALFVPAVWTFANDGCGIAADGSYFMKTDFQVRTKTLSGGGNHAAFVAYNPSKHLVGAISQKVTVAESGEYRLGFYIGSRSYEKKVYNVQVKILLDGNLLETYPETAQTVSEWTFHAVGLGELAAGEHEIKIMAPTDSGELWNMIDLVQLGKVSKNVSSTVFEPKQFANLNFCLGPDAKLQLELEGLDPVWVGRVEVEGVQRKGLLDVAETFIEGVGSIRASENALRILVR